MDDRPMPEDRQVLDGETRPRPVVGPDDVDGA
jgi:hypothetical protein